MLWLDKPSSMRFCVCIYILTITVVEWCVAAGSLNWFLNTQRYVCCVQCNDICGSGEMSKFLLLFDFCLQKIIHDGAYGTCVCVCSLWRRMQSQWSGNAIAIFAMHSTLNKIMQTTSQPAPPQPPNVDLNNERRWRFTHHTHTHTCARQLFFI